MNNDQLFSDNDDDDDVIPTIENLIKEGIEIPEEISKYVRVDIKEGGFLLNPIDENRTEISCIVTADPKMSYIPSYLINLGLKFAANYAIQTLKSTSIKISNDEIYQQRMRERSDVYEYLRKRLAEYNRSK